MTSVSACCSEGSARGTGIAAIVSTIGRSPITRPAAPRPGPFQEATADRLTPLALWALRQRSGDIDAEVLRWIASHAKGRKPLGLL